MDGLYIINGSWEFFCNQSTNGGGWSILTAGFWLGNDNIHVLTSIGSQILIELKDFENNTVHGSYGSFHVSNEEEQYVLEVNEFSGTAGDSISNP